MKKPLWLNKKFSLSACREVKKLLKQDRIHTVCEQALCPNISECFGCGVATFMILGKTCTRNCAFCGVSHDPPEKIDLNEPSRVKRAVDKLGLEYVVITSPTRDDLPDGGADMFYLTIKKVKTISWVKKVEVLIPDFGGSMDSLRRVIKAYPEVIGHNLETVPSLYGAARARADYHRSLRVLAFIKETCPDICTKSGLMLGLGEKKEEIDEVLRDLRRINCDFLSIGQYLPPSKTHFPVKRYVPPEEFSQWRRRALDMGFKSVKSGPYVRSSYMAHTYHPDFE